ncbi:MAG: winged helix DNA-binding protein [Nocardioidaceae bacterium]
MTSSRADITSLGMATQLSLAATSELVNDLSDLGYLARRPDPADGRAKLIDLTARGRGLLALAGERVAEIEHRWSATVGPGAFDHMCETMQKLVDELNPEEARS